MKMSAGALLAAGLWPGALAAQDAMADPFSFIWVNDLHYWDQGCVPFFFRMIQKMKQSATDAKLLIVGGDLVEHGKAEEFAGVDEVIKGIGLTTKVTIGNHDWTSLTDRKAFEQAHPNSLNYTFDHAGWQFVALDSSDGTKASVSVLKPTLDWIDENLPRIDRNRPMILVTHFPMGANVTNRAKNADAVLDRFRNHNLRGVFNGHYHAFTERTSGPCVLTTNKCCSFRAGNHDGTKEKGFFVCTAKDGKIQRNFIEVEMPPQSQA